MASQPAEAAAPTRPLRRDPGVQREAVVFVQPRVKQISEPDLEKLPGQPRLALPRPGEGKDAIDPASVIPSSNICPSFAS